MAVKADAVDLVVHNARVLTCADDALTTIDAGHVAIKGGLIVSLGKHTKNYDHFTALEKYNIPVVFFDRVPHLPDFNKVSFNMASGTREAIEFLIDQGHRRIGIINGPEEMKSSKERTETYKQVLIKKRLKIDLSLVGGDYQGKHQCRHEDAAKTEAPTHGHRSH